MSVVVWNGRSLAADRQADNQGYRHLISKIRRTRIGEVVAWTGDCALGQMMANWYENGKKEKDWPLAQNTDNWCRLIVAHLDGSCEYFEQYPSGIKVVGPYEAWGCGRDFAIGALAMCATAQQAIEITNQFCTGCGMGVEEYTPFSTLHLKKERKNKQSHVTH